MENQRIISNKPQLVMRNGKRHICGYALRYFREDDPDTIMQFSPNCIEIIEPRIFEKVVRTGQKVPLTIDHNPAKKLGYCTLDEDENGVWFDYELNSTDIINQEAIKMFEKNETVGTSWMGTVRTDKKHFPNGTKMRKMFNAVDFTEVCISFDAAYPAAMAVMRSLRIEQERKTLLLKYELFKLKFVG